MMFRLLVILAFVCASSASAAYRYVDRDATGANNGTNWANAWTNTTAINWSGLNNYTVYISGGTTSKTYSGFNIDCYGTGTNRLTIKLGQEAGHNGMAKFTGDISTYGNTNITIDGSRDDTFIAPTSVADLWRITNNIGFKFDNTGSMTVNNAKNVTIKWLEIAYAGAFSAGNDGVNGIYGPNSNAGQSYTNCEIGYCYIHDGSQDAINMQTAAGSAYDQIRVHHCLLIDNVDDGVQGGGAGWTLDHNIIGGRNLTWTNGHPDCFQVSGPGYHRIYNNILYNAWNSWVYLELGIASEWAATGNIQIFGNLMYNSVDWDAHQEPNYGIEIHSWTDQHGGINPDGPFTNAVMTNIFIVNNTIYRCRQSAINITETRQTSGGFVGIHNTHCTNWWIANNLLVDTAYDGGAGIKVNGTNINDAYNLAVNEGLVYGTNDVIFTHNNISGLRSNLFYRGLDYSGKTAFESAYPFWTQTETLPTFVGTNTNNLSLSFTDTVAKNTGTNLVSLTNLLQGLATDMYGVPRGQGKRWDVGFAEEGGPVVWLNFDDDLTDGITTDSSGLGSHGLRYGRPGTGTNWPTTVTRTNAQSGQTSAAANFDWYYDGWQDYGKSGDYVVITNISAFSNMTYATFAWWGRYDTGYGNDYTVDNNASFANAGYAKRGNWSLGRADVGPTAQTCITVVTNDSVDARDTRSLFNDYAAPSQGLTSWKHYAVTWNAGVATTYTDGVPTRTNTYPTVTNLTVNGTWIGLGCWTHVSSVVWHPGIDEQPTPIDDYPNNGWLNGAMDDFRIYNRALTSNEISTIYGSTQSESPQSQRITHRPKTVRVRVIRSAL